MHRLEAGLPRCAPTYPPLPRERRDPPWQNKSHVLLASCPGECMDKQCTALASFSRDGVPVLDAYVCLVVVAALPTSVVEGCMLTSLHSSALHWRSPSLVSARARMA